MSEFDGTVLFKEWLPDQPELNNPGLLEALNVLPTSSGYQSFPTVAATLSALASVPIGGMRMYWAGTEAIFVRNATDDLLASSGADFATMSGATTLGTRPFAKFAQFDNLGIAVDGGPNLRFTVGSSSYTALASSGTAPPAIAVGVVGRFIVLGGVNG